MFRPEHKCGIVAAICLAMCAVWPASAIYSAAIAFAAFCAVLVSYKLPSLTNLTFLFLCVTLIILLSDSILWSALLSAAGLESGEMSGSRIWAIQYIAMATDAMVLGACLVTWRSRNLDKPPAAWSSPLHCPWIYVIAAFVPLLLNLALYYLNMRGLEYVDIQKANLGPEKYILFLVIITHAAFMRLASGWKYLGRNSRRASVAAVCLFLYIYVFLMPMRTNLLIFGVYSFYFLERLIHWRLKVGLLVSGIVLFSWMAVHRGEAGDPLKEMGFTQATVSALSFGTGMVDMVPWAYEEVRSHGVPWGTTYLLGLVSPKYEPSIRYVQDTAPVIADEGGGFGFFYVAELLLNFGYLGGLLGACLLGMALQKLSNMPSEVVRSTILPALLAASFSLIRNDFLTTLKEPLYIVVSCFILDRLARFSLYMGGRIQFAGLASTTGVSVGFADGAGHQEAGR
jgi:oligosaccharide repeat unit polymerase